MRLLTPMAALLLLATFTTFVGTDRALACSVGPDFDPVLDSDTIIEGRFLGYEVVSDDSTSIGIPVKVTMEVHRVFKGEISVGNFVMEDRNSLTAGPSGYVWSGSGGSCGAFDSDPTGSYGIMGLTRREDGTYSPSGPLWFFHGNGPSGQAYEDAVARITSRIGTVSLPPTGTGGGSEGGASRDLLFALASSSTLTALSLAVLVLASRRHAV